MLLSRRFRSALKLTSLGIGALLLHIQANSSVGPKIESNRPDDASVFQKMRELNQMRESLAQTIPAKAEITEATFAAVCRPVGAELKRWAEANGVRALQISHKNRNPAHGVPAELKDAYQEFSTQSDLVEKKVPLLQKEGPQKTPQTVFLARIPVVQACLRCHGERANRPQFIVDKFPQDKAYGFKVGDLRGVYAIWRYQ